MTRVLVLLLAWTQGAHAAVDPAAHSSAASPLYGQDDRRDLYELADRPDILALADSTVALFQLSKVTKGEPWTRLTTKTYGEALRLCGNERFWKQPSGAFCSGALVGPDLVLTAGHCVRDVACEQTAFVFGFDIREKGHDPTRVLTQDVYGCAELVGRAESREGKDWGADWALVRLDRAVKDHQPLDVDRGDADVGTPLLVIGHPSGLPTKVAGNASVQRLAEDYFLSNLDAYKGNSGSPVFNADTHRIEGILVRGAWISDFISKGSCQSSIILRDNYGGEGVTKISLVSELIPEPPQRPPEGSCDSVCAPPESVCDPDDEDCVPEAGGELDESCRACRHREAGIGGPR